MKVCLVSFALLTLLTQQIYGAASAADTPPVRSATNNPCHWFSTPQETTLFAQSDPADNAGRARYYSALLDLYFKDVELVHDAHTKASCYAFIMSYWPDGRIFLDGHGRDFESAVLCDTACSRVVCLSYRLPIRAEQPRLRPTGLRRATNRPYPCSLLQVLPSGS